MTQNEVYFGEYFMCIWKEYMFYGSGCSINVNCLHLIDSGFIFPILPHTTTRFFSLLVLAAFERVVNLWNTIVNITVSFFSYVSFYFMDFEALLFGTDLRLVCLLSKLFLLYKISFFIPGHFLCSKVYFVWLVT